MEQIDTKVEVILKWILYFAKNTNKTEARRVCRLTKSEMDEFTKKSSPTAISFSLVIEFFLHFMSTSLLLFWILFIMSYRNVLNDFFWWINQYLRPQFCSITSSEVLLCRLLTKKTQLKAGMPPSPFWCTSRAKSKFLRNQLNHVLVT